MRLGSRFTEEGFEITGASAIRISFLPVTKGLEVTDSRCLVHPRCCFGLHSSIVKIEHRMIGSYTGKLRIAFPTKQDEFV